MSIIVRSPHTDRQWIEVSQGDMGELFGEDGTILPFTLLHVTTERYADNHPNNSFYVVGSRYLYKVKDEIRRSAPTSVFIDLHNGMYRTIRIGSGLNGLVRVRPSEIPAHTASNFAPQHTHALQRRIETHFLRIEEDMEKLEAYNNIEAIFSNTPFPAPSEPSEEDNHVTPEDIQAGIDRLLGDQMRFFASDNLTRPVPALNIEVFDEIGDADDW